MSGDWHRSGPQDDAQRPGSHTQTQNLCGCMVVYACCGCLQLGKASAQGIMPKEGTTAMTLMLCLIDLPDRRWTLGALYMCCREQIVVC